MSVQIDGPKYPVWTWRWYLWVAWREMQLQWGVLTGKIDPNDPS